MQPLRVAVAGRVKAGKSTLVNALVGQKIAPTAIEECTKVVTLFTYGVPERLELLLSDGARQSLPLVDGRIPDPLGPPLEEVQSVHVYLSRERLRGVTLIDTPGLSSVNREYSTRTETLLLDRVSRNAAEHADALVFLMSHGVRQDDAEMLASFRALFEGAHASPATAVGVLSRADQVSSGDEDPLPVAKKLAARQSQALQSVACAVVPTIGLLAETAEGQTLEERDAEALRTLAELEPERRGRLLFSHEEFLAFESPVASVERQRLLSMLDLYGVGKCLELIDGGVTGASELEAKLRDLSGISELRALLDDSFLRRGDTLKAHAALTALSELSWEQASGPNADVLRRMRTAIEHVRLEPEMRSINEIWAAQAATSEDVYLPAELREDLARLVARSDPAGRVGLDPSAGSEEIADAARRAATRWRAFGNVGATSDVEERVARIIYRSFEGLAERASTAPAPTS
jgi:hypothetical protein